MKNALSVDLEDWFCVYNMRNIIGKDEWNKCELRVQRNTDLILKMLNKFNVKATFFVLGYIAKQVPKLIQDIDKEGHEIAVHGYSHTLLTELNHESFREDLDKAIQLIKPLINQPIMGFRAPSFSVVQKTLWAFDIMEEKGIKYDSSVFPIGSHPDYGIPNAPLSIYQTENSIIEFPLSCAKILGMRIPCSGGGYFRIFPYSLTKFLLKKCNSQERPVIFYIHPWEFDPEQPKIKLPLLNRFRHYYNLDKTEMRFEKLLNDFEFTTVKEVLDL